MASSKTVISVVILLVIGLHAAPVLLWRERGTLWPFMRWTMYMYSPKPGPINVHQRRIVAITAAGAADTVTPHLVGLSITVLKQRYLGPIGNGDRAAAAELVERLNRDRSDPVVELRLTGETYTVTDTGVARSEYPPVTFRAGREEPR
jgi:hypothetical protein